MGAVFKRECKAYLNNLYGCVFMAGLLFACGLFASYFNLVNYLPAFEYTLLFGQYALALFVPVLCMRSMAEDRRNKTDAFCFSLPISPLSVVLGKYFALLTMLAIPTAVMALYPLVLSAFGEVDLISAYVGLLFFFLVGASLLALCQFLSSLTDRLWLAAVLGLVATLVLAALALVAGLLPSGTVWDTVGGILSYLSPFSHLGSVALLSLVELPSLLYLLCFPVFFVFLTTLSVKQRRFA